MTFHSKLSGGSGSLADMIGSNRSRHDYVGTGTCAAAIRNSSLRVLLPPVASPVQSSRLIHGLAHPEQRLDAASPQAVLAGDRDEFA